jgi:ABC-type phosphate transport system auxiliary subunit
MEEPLNLAQLRKEKSQLQSRIQTLQEKLEALEAKETELENTEILKTVRALSLKPSELDGLLDRLKCNPFEVIKNIKEWEPEKE